MATNLRHCGSAPSLPFTTPQPRAQAFDAISRAKAAPSTSNTNGGTIYAAKLALREQRKRELDAETLLIRNERLREENVSLQQEVTRLRQEAKQHSHQLKAMEARVDKVSLRSENLIGAIAASKVDEASLAAALHLPSASSKAIPEDAPGPAASPHQNQIEDEGVRRAHAQAKTKINWGGTNVLAFKKALHVLTAERNEALARAQVTAKQLAALQNTCEDLRNQVRELAFQNRFAKEQSTATLSDLAPGAAGSRRKTTLPSVRTTLPGTRRGTVVAHGHAGQRTSLARKASTVVAHPEARRALETAADLEVVDSLQSDMDGDIDALDTMPKLLYDLYVKLGISHQLHVETSHAPDTKATTKVPLLASAMSGDDANHGAAMSAAEADEEMSRAVKRAQTFSKSQARHLVDLVRHMQASITGLFHLSQSPRAIVSTQSERTAIDLFSHVSEACKEIVPGVKHVTLWIMDTEHNKENMWTRSARKGSMVEVSFRDEADSGIAGHVARNGKCVVLNNCVLGDNPDYVYNPKVDHLGSVREFAGTSAQGEGYSKQSLATIPIFRDTSAYSDGSPTAAATEPQTDQPVAILQASKSASKSHPTSHRTFSDAQVLALSLFAHAALWVLENIRVMQHMRSHDNAIQAMLHFPRGLARSLGAPPSARKTEGAKCELLRRLEIQVVETLPGARRCRIFARRAPPASDSQAPGTLHWVPVASYARLLHDDWDSMNRSSCVANSGLAGDIVRSGLAFCLEDPYNDPRFNANIDLETEGLALIAAPIYAVSIGHNEKRLWGVLQISLPWGIHTAPSVVDTVVADLVPQIALAIALSQIDAVN
ncbi:Hypothetical Protein FCC1311_008712 [Hondaea fermentalgiana]|uniref:GAF domain-containing protein n=1 Tax=Hondaea fermentalgiana TaxID=2315210 RepID=A0A2R5G841_9STRA|nr:Hypothetical Protein FCC1311_008712 [Hondaea fermentalgiana]|eukprot:GBG24653.1 Hypothetical Protein FCC1311_008712 [Hondaea fermentalgiana]